MTKACVFFALISTISLSSVPAARSIDKPPLVAFVTDRDAPGSLEIQLVGTDGNGRIRLARHSPSGYDAAWSPNGRMIAFTAASSADPGRADGIWLMNLHGAGVHRLIAGGSAPSWSPDGRTIAFVKNGQLWVVRADGSGAKRLVRLPVEEQTVAW